MHKTHEMKTVYYEKRLIKYCTSIYSQFYPELYVVNFKNFLHQKEVVNWWVARIWWAVHNV